MFVTKGKSGPLARGVVGKRVRAARLKPCPDTNPKQFRVLSVECQGCDTVTSLAIFVRAYDEKAGVLRLALSRAAPARGSQDDRGWVSSCSLRVISSD
jgi:hypothetical protein